SAGCVPSGADSIAPPHPFVVGRIADTLSDGVARPGPSLEVPPMSTAAPAAPALLLDQRAGVARVTLNRPHKRNALSAELLADLEATLTRLAGDDAVRVVVVAAAGPVFSSGHDLTEMTGGTEAAYRDLFERCSRVMQLLRKLPQPVVARVQG